MISNIKKSGAGSQSGIDWTDRTHLIWNTGITIGITGNSLSVSVAGYRGIAVKVRYNGSYNPTVFRNVPTYNGDYQIIAGQPTYEYMCGCNVNMSNDTALFSIPAGTGHSTGASPFWGNNGIEILEIYGIK